ncbi:unnamed protein product, partial [Owenia fusiformis]
TTVNGLHFQWSEMHLIYFGLVPLMLSTVTEISAEIDPPNDRLKEVLLNSGLGVSVVRVLESGKGFLSNIWKQPFSPARSSFQRHLTEARNITERERIPHLIKALQALAIGLDNVNKVMESMTAFQSRISKVETLLRDTRNIQVKTGHVELVQGIYDDIVGLLNLFDADRNNITFIWYKTIIQQVEHFTYEWLDLYFSMDQSAKKMFRYMKKRIRYLQKITSSLSETYERDVDGIAKELKYKLRQLNQASAKTVRIALGYDFKLHMDDMERFLRAYGVYT